jgi:hypothetical protein
MREPKKPKESKLKKKKDLWVGAEFGAFGLKDPMR